MASAIASGVQKIVPIPNIRSEMLWAQLLDVTGNPELARRIQTRASQPVMAKLQLDIYLLLAYLARPDTPILEDCPDYPFLFYPPKGVVSKFEGVGTNSRSICVKYALWLGAVEVYNEAAGLDIDNRAYAVALVRAYQLTMMANGIGECWMIPEYEPPTIHMNFVTILSLYLEMLTLRHCETKMGVTSDHKFGIHRNIGMYLQELQQCPSLPRKMAEHLVKCREWHRRVLAEELCKRHKTWILANEESLREVASRLFEMESLLSATDKTDSDMYKYAQRELYTIGRRGDASGYVPHEWADIVNGSIYSVLPEVDSRADAIQKMQFTYYADQLFPDLKGLWKKGNVYMASNIDSSVSSNLSIAEGGESIVMASGVDSMKDAGISTGGGLGVENSSSASFTEDDVFDAM